VAGRRTFSTVRRGRRKRTGAWNGGTFGITVPSAPASVLAVVLWEPPTSQELNMAGRGLHRYTHVTFAARPNANSGDIHNLYWYMKVFQGDQTGAVPAALVVPPADNSATFARMPLMLRDMDQFGAVGSSSVTGLDWDGSQKGKRHSFECKAKRRIDDTDSLLLVFGASTANSFTVNGLWRTYVSW